MVAVTQYMHPVDTYFLQENLSPHFVNKTYL